MEKTLPLSPPPPPSRSGEGKEEPTFFFLPPHPWNSRRPRSARPPFETNPLRPTCCEDRMTKGAGKKINCTQKSAYGEGGETQQKNFSFPSPRDQICFFSLHAASAIIIGSHLFYAIYLFSSSSSTASIMVKKTFFRNGRFAEYYAA